MSIREETTFYVTCEGCRLCVTRSEGTLPYGWKALEVKIQADVFGGPVLSGDFCPGCLRVLANQLRRERKQLAATLRAALDSSAPPQVDDRTAR